jgi:hypothetical protein
MVEEAREGCRGHEDDLAGLALGIVTGRDRAQALAHIDDCQWCNDELNSLAIVADRVFDLVPCREPPLGFEVGIMERFRACERRSRRGQRLRRIVDALQIAERYSRFSSEIPGH